MRSDAEDLWRIEESLWTGGADLYANVLHPECVMAFPDPAGVMRRDQILGGVANAPRWSGVEMLGRVFAEPSEGVAIMAYRAKAMRAGEKNPYSAICTSAYVARSGEWRMVQHQQALLD